MQNEVVLSVGQVVISKCGRDKRRYFVVCGVNEGYAYLADGKLRLISKLKKKKIKHIQPTNDINAEIAAAFKSAQRRPSDSDIRKVLIQYKQM